MNLKKWLSDGRLETFTTSENELKSIRATAPIKQPLTYSRSLLDLKLSSFRIISIDAAASETL
jgi:hypothetical protein